MMKHPSLHFDVAAIEKGAFGSLPTKVANFTYMEQYKQSVSDIQIIDERKNSFCF